MRRSLTYRVLRLAGRVGLALAGAIAIGLIGMQFEGIVAKNVAIARELSRSRADIAALRARAARQRATVSRLGSARGAVPEIHEKLGLVAPHEELIYVRGAAAPAADASESAR